jgi:hypothetical protein
LKISKATFENTVMWCKRCKNHTNITQKLLLKNSKATFEKLKSYFLEPHSQCSKATFESPPNIPKKLLLRQHSKATFENLKSYF